MSMRKNIMALMGCRPFYSVTPCSSATGLPLQPGSARMPRCWARPLRLALAVISAGRRLQALTGPTTDDVISWLFMGTRRIFVEMGLQMARAARFAIAVLCITRAVTTATASVVSISNKDPRLDTSGKIMVRNAPDCSALLGLLLRAAVRPWHALTAMTSTHLTRR
jgi:hypothetical protein